MAGAAEIKNRMATIGSKVEVEKFFLTPTKLAQLIDNGLMTPHPNHKPNDPLRKVYSADKVRQAQAEVVALDRKCIAHRLYLTPSFRYRDGQRHHPEDQREAGFSLDSLQLIAEQ